MTEAPVPKTEFAPVNGARIAFDVSGSGPALLLLHAGLGDRQMWDDQLAAFAEQFTVVRYDARGFGETIMPPAPFSASGDAIGLLDYLQIAQAHVVGVSMGAQTAIELAVSAPERVASLVAVAARTGTPVSPELRADWDQVNALVEAGDVEGAVEYELRMWIDGPERGAEAVAPAVRERVRAMNAALFARDDDQGEEIPLAPPAEERLADITAPTLVLYGDRDHLDVRRAAAPLAAAIPGTRLAVIPDAGHLPQMERPEAFNQIVLDFLQDVGAASPEKRLRAGGC